MINVPARKGSALAVETCGLRHPSGKMAELIEAQGKASGSDFMSVAAC